ncbi:MAG: 2-oxoacid:acceptor oxidoreductase subunit alpha [Planctomycetota bacterium]|jgi:2-oxoglutarate ferredoxin oxidoreductase subunit alpha
MSSDTSDTPKSGNSTVVKRVSIRFAGDSGDGMQITGTQFTNTSALVGNDLATFPDFPAEIRAPAGTLPGVSGFQLQFSSEPIHTPGDRPDVLIAMNPAALKVNVPDLPPNATIIVNTDEFTSNNLKKAGYTENPLENGSLDEFRVVPVDLTRLTVDALEPVESLNTKEKKRCKNFFALGLVYWLYQRPLEPTLEHLKVKFKKRPEIVEANTLALNGGYNFGSNAEAFLDTYEVPAAPATPGRYRNISGNDALALGLAAATEKSGLKMVYGTYPITPASDVLHSLSRYKNYGIYTFQAEDEIAAVAVAIGASFGGAIGVTGSSGPGIALKAEAIGLAMITELPLVVINVQRGGPSTGLPTKTEQSDLLQVLYGRNGESPCCVIAAQSPGDCFYTAYEATRIALKYMLPVFILSDGYLANGAEPWPVPDLDALEPIEVRMHTDAESFVPYGRDATTLARPWAPPGTPGCEHRIGGLEKSDGSGNVSYDPENHDMMVRMREEKVARIVQDVPDIVVQGNPDADVLVVGWGGTHGAITGAVESCNQDGTPVAQIHLRHLNPFPANLETVLRGYRKILVPEINRGQLSLLLRARFLIDVQGFNKVRGQPLKVGELREAIKELANS